MKITYFKILCKNNIIPSMLRLYSYNNVIVSRFMENNQAITRLKVVTRNQQIETCQFFAEHVKSIFFGIFSVIGSVIFSRIIVRDNLAWELFVSKYINLFVLFKSSYTNAIPSSLIIQIYRNGFTKRPKKSTIHRYYIGRSILKTSISS